MRFFYDTEFIEDGVTIDLVSIGIVAEDGRELYCISSDFSESKLHANPWLTENVWPSLPQTTKGHRCRCRFGHLDRDHPDVRNRRQIARAVEAFLLAGVTEADPKPELWAWCGAYDHVVLCHLWGDMSALPSWMPHWTNDLRQEVHRLGDPQLPPQDAGLHNALADARHLAENFGRLKKFARGPL